MADRRFALMVTGRPAVYAKAVAVPAHVLVREVADELVLLSLESEDYFGLDPVGARIWHLLQSEGTVRDAFEAMLAEYDVDGATLAHDLEVLLHELSSRHLIELVEARASQPRP